MTIDMKSIHDSDRTLVMGVLNITEDSFSDGGLLVFTIRLAAVAPITHAATGSGSWLRLESSRLACSRAPPM